MSSENKDQQIPAAPPVETNHESQKKTKISYSRDFLLAFRDSDDCQKFPAGFDQSLISEFGDTSQDRQRISGGLSLQSSRHSEYGSSPPIRGDSSNYSQGIRGRWESRSSGRSDKDSDLQSDWDSDSGRRYGSNQSRRSWQVPDHDGLLGSGSFPRPSGYAAGALAPRSQTNDHYQLNRSNEPYHPPRPYKAVPHSRKETDLYNDETFGISESPSVDRAEEEKKRRASFELMRKEQQRAFQEKQKLNPDKHNNDFDITTLLEDSKDEKKILDRNNESDERLILPASNNDSGKSTFSSQTSASRPLVPPGFTTTVLERNFGTKPLVHPHSAEAVNAVFGNSLLHTKGKCELNENSSNQEEKQSTEHMDLNRQQLGTTGIHLSFDSKGEKIPNLSSALDISSETVGMGSQSDLSEVFEASEIGEAVEFDVEKVIGNKIVGKSNQDHSNTILDKLFSGALTLNGGGSRIIEHQGNKEDDLWSPNTVHSSKFARWFLEDEKKPIEECSSGHSNDLLSLIVGGEKGKSQVPNAKTTELIPPKLLLQKSELAERHMASDIPVTDGNSEKFYNNKSEGVPVVLTCEDLEQSILSEISEKGSTEKKASTLQPRVPGWSILDVKSEQPKNNIDDRASQHLLSLLQKGTDSNDMTPFSNLENSFSDKEHNIEAASISTGLDKSRDAKVEIGLNSSKTLTLETLFGTAFMKELQSVGAPVSVQRGSGGASGVGDSEPHGLPIPVMNDGVLPSFLGAIGYNTTSHESSALVSNQIPQTKMSKIEEQWLDFNDSRAAMDSSKFQTEIGSKQFVDQPPDIRLPEEDSLIIVSNPANLQHFMPARNPAKPEFLSFPNTSGDIAEKLAALNRVFSDEKPNVVQEGPPLLRGPFDTRDADIPYQNLHVQPSSPQLHPPQLNHAGPLFQPLAAAHPAHKNSQMKFMAQEGIFHHEPPPSHRLPANMTHHPPFHQPSAGLTGFDPPPHHPMLQQMHMPGNFPPSHLLRGFPGGALMPPHPSNQVTAMQGLPFSQRPPNFGDLGMPPLASDGVGGGGGSNHPEAFRRLIEMELRSNSKQFHPFAPGGHSQGMYEMGFGHR